MDKVLVAGATGGTGREVMKLLAKASGFRASAMVRRPEQVEQFAAQGVDAVLGDLSADVSAAPVGFDKVIFAAGSTGYDVRSIDQDGAKRFVDACKAAGVRKFVMMSSMGADNPYQHNVLRDYMIAKMHADNHLKASGLVYSICQPGYLNDGPARGRISIADRLIEFGDISRKDVAAALVACLPDQVARNKLFVIWDGDTPIDTAVASI